ncbi:MULTISPECIES: MFS transporter [Streptomyces]|uniref:MFS transporter n=1 Tax=Streptomyces eurythermus TaxID=42237 RepID=A0ABW6YZ29_9ACTN|nr:MULTISPECIES: MFS transporter [Streptomyces]QIS69931.1 MFS transporter [Streptomyces sp. DSM 40868]
MTQPSQEVEQRDTEGGTPLAVPGTPHRRRAMTVLTSAQMLYYFGISIDLTLTGLAGLRLAPVPALATLPFALISVGSWAATYPASRFMRSRGRKAGFLVGSGAALTGGITSVTALLTEQFVLFCFGIACIGVHQAFAGYYRYAAADMFPPEERGKAISTVLSGGVIAAVAGPFLATAVKDLGPVEFTGSYALVTVLALISLGVLSTLTAEDTEAAAAAPSGPQAAAEDAAPRTLGQIAKQPVFLAGVAGSCVGYFTMTSLMAAAPIAAVRAGHSVHDGAQVIQWHMVGMYATAFASGPLTRSIGAGRTLLIGAAVSALGAATALTGLSHTHFMIALGLIGVGWNLMYVSGSALVAHSYRPRERSLVQGIGEVFTLGGSAVGALAAGPVLDALGWESMNAALLVPLAVSAVVTVAHLRAARPRAAAQRTDP